MALLWYFHWPNLDTIRGCTILLSESRKSQISIYFLAGWQHWHIPVIGIVPPLFLAQLGFICQVIWIKNMVYIFPNRWGTAISATFGLRWCVSSSTISWSRPSTRNTWPRRKWTIYNKRPSTRNTWPRRKWTLYNKRPTIQISMVLAQQNLTVG